VRAVRARAADWKQLHAAILTSVLSRAAVSTCLHQAPIAFVLVTVYAPLMSVRALKSEESKDDGQWLSFWVVWSVLQTVDGFTWGILWLFPFFAELRFGLLIFMLFFGGSKKASELVIDPLYTLAQKFIPEDLMEMLEKDPKGFLMKTYEKMYEKGMALYRGIAAKNK